MTPTRPRWTTLLVLLLVPALVAGAFLWGTWHSDARLRSVQAAVVNNDEMVEVNGQPTPLGRQLAAELVDSDRDQNFTWVLANDDNAAAGLASGQYAAVVTIPKEFSAAATSFSANDASAVKATIAVQTSPVAGLSETALGQSITDAAVRALNQFLTEEYLKNIYVGFNDMHDQMGELVDGTRQLADGAGELADGTGQLADGALQAADGSWQLAEGATQTADGARQLADGADQAAAGTSRLADGLSLASANSGLLRDGAAASADGAVALASGARQLADGTTAWADGAGTYATGVGTYATGAQTYADGVAQYTGTVNGLLTPVRSAIAALPEWGGWLDEAQAWVDRAPELALAVDARVQDVVAGVRELLDRVDRLVGAGEEVRGGVRTAASTVDALASGAGVACPERLTSVEGACEAFADGVAAAGARATEALDPVVADARSMGEAADRVTSVTAQLRQAADALATASSRLAEWAPTLQQQLADLQSSLPEGTTLSKAGVLALIDQFIDGGNQLAGGGQQLADGAVALADGALQLQTGAQQLADGMTALSDGTGQLAGGLGELSTGVAAYTGGVDQAASGAQQLAGGVGQLASGTRGLSGGLDQLASGTSDLAGGIDDLASGTGQLADGATQLADGTDTLADGVADGADQIPTYTQAERDTLAAVVAAPVDADGLGALVRPGLAWASLLLVLALWLGALATFAAWRPVGRRTMTSTDSTGRLLGRVLAPGLAVVGLQAVLLAGMGAWALRLDAPQAAALTGVLLVAGAVFGLVNHGLAGLLGHVGRLVSLAMALVTAVVAATQAAPPALQAFTAVSPASTALTVVRDTVLGRDVVLGLLALLAWGVLGLAAGAYAVARSRTVPLDRLVMSTAA